MVPVLAGALVLLVVGWLLACVIRFVVSNLVRRLGMVAISDVPIIAVERATD